MGNPREARLVSDEVFDAATRRLGYKKPEQIIKEVAEKRWPFDVTEEQMRKDIAALKETGK